MLLAELPSVLHRLERPREAEGGERGVGERRLRDEGDRGAQRAPEGAEHRPVVDRLRRRDRGVRVAHRRRRDHAALQDETGLDAEEGWLPQRWLRELAPT